MKYWIKYEYPTREAFEIRHKLFKTIMGRYLFFKYIIDNVGGRVVGFGQVAT